MYIPQTYTVESVTAGHPDKVCDQISDAILDEALRQDPYSRVAVEVFGAHDLLVIGGEVTTNATIDYQGIARKVYTDIGFTDSLQTVVNIIEQSPDISQGVDTGGAGDQGIMYGFSTNETPEYLPSAVSLAHGLAKKLDEFRRTPEGKNLLLTGKTQVTIINNTLDTVLVSMQNNGVVAHEDLKKLIYQKIVLSLVPGFPLEKFLFNPTGKFEIGGFTADTGLTGRKIMVDTYGGILPHGGGCFSGKDATKVDRSAAYMARFAAKNIVASGLANQCLVSVAYAIGKEQPLMLDAVNEKGQSLKPILTKNFDFRPLAIIERLSLRTPIYQPTATYGHFGHPSYPWEQIIPLQ